MEYRDMVMTALLALGCGLAALLLKNGRSELLRYMALLIQQAEAAVRGSGMGAEKKALVLAQLEAAGIRSGVWLERQIDRIVGRLNGQGAWLAGRLQQELEDSHE